MRPAARLARSLLLLPGLAVALGAAPARADNAELITVTTDSAVATWVTPAPADTTVCWGRSSAGEQCRTQETATTRHYAVMPGLTARTRYVYELRSGGNVEAVGAPNPGSFTTLTPPGGRHLFDFALLNDTHVGEGCAGTAFNDPLLGTSVPACFSAPDYAGRMDAGMVQEIAARRIPLTIINGDVTAEAKPAELAEAKQIFGRLPGTVLIGRGNHDRVHEDAEHACGSDHDCFRTAFYPSRPPGRMYGSTDFRGYHFVMLDSVKGSSTGDLTDAAQNAWFARDLAAHRSQPTFVFFHHPASEVGDTFQEEPVIFGVPPQNGGTEFLDTVAANPQIVGVLQAHTHRNFNSYALKAGNRVPFIENGTSKEYPGGYSVFSVYRGGYTRSYFRPSGCAFCREWTETTRGEFYGLAQQYLLGSLGTRNFSHVYGCGSQSPAASLPGTESLLTGGVVSPPASCIRGADDDDPPGRPGCLARRAPIGARGIGRVRLGLTRRTLLRRVPTPRRRGKHAWRWCVKRSKGTLVAAFTGRGRVALVATTAGGHHVGRVHPGSRTRTARRAFRRRRTLSHTLIRLAPHSPRLLGIRRGRVRYAGVTSRRTLARPRRLRAYLRYAGH